MDKFQKDKEIIRLRSLLKARNATIRSLKNKSNPAPSEEGHVEVTTDDDTEAAAVAAASDMFRTKSCCDGCGKAKIDAISFCTACSRGWGYCNKCGGIERAQEANREHITPTHGVFLDMFDKNEAKNSYEKPN